LLHIKIKAKNNHFQAKKYEEKVEEPIKSCEVIIYGQANGWSKSRVLKGMRSVKEYVQVEYLGEKQIVLVYQ